MVMDDNTISKNDLNTLENKFNSNEETIEDYIKLDYFLTKMGLPDKFLLSITNKDGLYTYEDLFRFRKSKSEPPNPVKEGKIGGTFTGLISFIKDRL